ncbi:MULTISPECIES: phage tail domain-containing protein [unclassified Nocardiopsis]|uniref:phage distal tail protein n=1 Tax=unclassified Nocardiopsis TaxID=2649073 RepID=UPI001357076C|nr:MULTISPECIES: phage tail domain-containing protein [unclassified Nocardiopsis]
MTHTQHRTITAVPMVLAEPSPQPLVITLQAGVGEAAVTLSTDPHPDEAGALWVLSDVEGWLSTPPTEPVLTPLGLSDRSAAAARFPMSAREITVHGHVLSPAFDTAESARHRLYRAFDGYTQDIPITVSEAVPKRIMARIGGAIETEPIGPSHFAFAVPLVLPDPLKYSVVQRGETTDAQATGDMAVSFPLTYPLVFTGPDSGTGRMTLSHEGTAHTFPISTITGPLPAGWRIINETTGETLSFTTALGARQKLTIDHGARTADIDGYSIAALASGTWWPLIPGRNALRFLTPAYDPAAQWTATFYDAYL